MSGDHRGARRHGAGALTASPAARLAPTSRLGGATHPPGFTLVELLIALAIVGALLAVAFGGLRVALGSWRQGEERTEAHQHVRGVAVLIARALGGTFPYVASPGDAPDPKLLFRGEESRIEFVTQTPPFPMSIPIAFTAVVVALESGEGLVIRERALPNRDPFSEAAVVLRDPNVTALTFRYMDEGGSWESKWDDEKNPPRAVEVTLETTLNGRREPLPPLTIPMRFSEQ